MKPLRSLKRQLDQLPSDHRPRRLASLVSRNLNYWLFQHIRRDLPLTVRVEGLALRVLPGVFNPAWFHTTPELVRVVRGLPVDPGKEALELCTGSGAGAVALGMRGLSVTAVDINPRAVECARLNVERHGLSSGVTVLEGDLYGPVGGRRFDLIVSNPPFLDGVPRDAREQAFFGGPGGEVLERLILEAPAHLKPGGLLVVTYSSLGPRGRIEGLADRAGMRVREVLRKDLWSEIVEHFVIEA